MTWTGNAFGEIGSVVMRKDLDRSTDWSRSSARVNVTRIATIPPSGTDPRTWPITYRYEGEYDPIGNGHWEFEGEFELNAFGGFKVNEHRVVSRSLMDFAIAGEPEEYVVVVPITWLLCPRCPRSSLPTCVNTRPALHRPGDGQADPVPVRRRCRTPWR